MPGFEALENGRVIWGLGNGSAWALIITLQINTYNRIIRDGKDRKIQRKQSLRVSRLRMTVFGTYRSRNRNPPMHGYGKTFQASSRCGCFLALALSIPVQATYNHVHMVLHLGGWNLAIFLQKVSC